MCLLLALLRKVHTPFGDALRNRMGRGSGVVLGRFIGSVLAATSEVSPASLDSTSDFASMAEGAGIVSKMPGLPASWIPAPSAILLKSLRKRTLAG
jgi:hypothetical protein